MKVIITFVALVFVLLAAPTMAQKTIYQTYPGGVGIDYSKPGMRVDGNRAQPTYPGSSGADYSKPGYVREGNTIRQTYPGGGGIDYSKPGYVVQ
ncbi:MAG: hypothetical protein NTW90_06785 [Nitrosospira sp.]|nr:hypothetical protein [Nitrosospira sp.]